MLPVIASPVSAVSPTTATASGLQLGQQQQQDDLQGHFFLQSITLKFPNVYSALLQNDWILCVPMNISQTSFLTDRDFRITEDFVATHILRTSSSDIEYVTLNNKSVFVREDTIVTDKGFQEQRTCQILFDDLVIDENSKTFVVYCIDQPLEGGPQVDNDKHVAESVLSLTRVLGSLGDRGRNELHRIDNYITEFNDRAVEVEDLDHLHSLIKSLLLSSLAIVDKTDESLLHSALARFELTKENLHQMVETHVMEKTYEMVYYRITTLHRDHDSILANEISNIQHIDLCQIGLSPTLGGILTNALKEFQNLSALRTPFEKLKCLVRSMQHLTKSPEGELLNADSLIPLMLLMVVRGNVLNLQSNLYYMKNFIFQHDVVTGEYGFALSCLEAVLHYIETNIASLSRMSDRTQQFWESIINNDMNAVEEALSTFQYHQDRLDKHNGTANSVTSSQESIGSPSSISEFNVLQCRNWSGDDALLLAIQNQHIDLVKFFLDKGLTCEITNYAGDNSLHVAARAGSVEIMKILLEHTDDFDVANSHGDTPLLLASQKGYLEIVKMLVERGADTHRQNSAGNTPLHYANKEIAEFLLGLDTEDNMPTKPLRLDINAINSEGLSPLLYHLQHGRLDVVDCLLACPECDTHIHDLGHRTALHLCTFRGYESLVQRLIQIDKCDINAKSMRGNTPLHAASDASQLNVVKMLLEYGADPTILNIQSRTAADLARDQRIRDLLDDYSLFSKRTEGERVAAVVRAQVVKENDAGSPNSLGSPTTPILSSGSGTAKFIIKSGTCPHVDAITTVHRHLDDFVFLKSQLQTEFPEAALPDLKDLSSSAYVGRQQWSSRLLKRIVQRLNKFISYLLQHPVFSIHELVWEFLVVPEIDRDLVIARTQSKHDYLLETIYDTYSPLVENPEVAEAAIKSAYNTLSALSSGIKDVGQIAKKLGKARKELANQLRILRYHIGRPTSTLIENKYVVGDVLRNICEVISKQSTIDTWELSDFLLEHNHVVSGATQILSRHSQVSNAYTMSTKVGAQQTAVVTRLEAQMKAVTSSQTDERVKRLSEAYYALERSQEETQRCASLLNYTEQCVKSELGFFHEYHARDMESLLNTYVHKQLAMDTEALQLLENALKHLNISSNGRKDSTAILSADESLEEKPLIHCDSDLVSEESMIKVDHEELTAEMQKPLEETEKALIDIS